MTTRLPVAMDKLTKPPAPNAEIPQLSEFSQTCAELLQENCSPLAILETALPVLLREVRTLLRHGEKGLTRVVTLLEQKMELRETGGLLFHAIPRAVLKSMVLRTVAYDHYQSGQVDRGHGYKFARQQPGVYVVAISIEGRNGRFLSGNELKTLYLDMQKYLDCYDRVQKARAEGVAPSADALDEIRTVDTMYGEAADPDISKFVQGASGIAKGSRDHALMLADSLRKAHLAAMEKDPTGNTVTIQSPCYVGCSENLWERMNMYIYTAARKENKTALSQVSKLYGLTLSLLARRGLEPKPHFLTAIRTWKPDQLQTAEELVSIMAGAYVSQFGFNVRGTGQSRERKPHAQFANEVYVTQTEPYLRQNLAWSMEDVAHRQALQAHKSRIAKIPAQKAEINRALEVANGLAEQGQQIKDFRVKHEEGFEAIHERLESQNMSTAAAQDVMEEGLAIFERFVPGFGGSDDRAE